MGGPSLSHISPQQEFISFRRKDYQLANPAIAQEAEMEAVAILFVLLMLGALVVLPIVALVIATGTVGKSGISKTRSAG